MMEIRILTSSLVLLHLYFLQAESSPLFQTDHNTAASDKSYPSSPGHIYLPQGSSADEVEAARLRLWKSSVTDTINARFSGVCKRHVKKVVQLQENPEDLCQSFKKHSKVFQYATCIDKDISFLEKVICNLNSITVSIGQPSRNKATDPYSAIPSPSSLSASPGGTSKASSSEQPNASPSSSSPTSISVKSDGKFDNSSSQSDENLSKTLTSEYTPKVKPTQSEVSSSAEYPNSATDTLIRDNQNDENTATQKPNQISHNKIWRHQQTRLLTSDSRLSPECNKLLPSISLFLSTEHDMMAKRCHGFRLFVEGIVSMKADNGSMFPGTDVVQISCSHSERELLHEMLCSDIDTQLKAHALRDQQQENVLYVIKSELTPTCSLAVRQMGEGKMEEEARESCKALEGPDGERLVNSKVCTQDDVVYLRKAVCNTASRQNDYLIHSGLILISLLCIYYIGFELL